MNEELGARCGTKNIDGGIVLGVLLRGTRRSSFSCLRCYDMGGARWFLGFVVKQSSLLNVAGGNLPDDRGDGRRSVLLPSPPSVKSSRAAQVFVAREIIPELTVETEAEQPTEHNPERGPRGKTTHGVSRHKG